MPIESVDFAHLTMSAQTGFDTQFAKSVRIDHVKILTGRGPAFRFADSTAVALDRAAGSASAALVTVSGAKSSGIHLANLPPSAEVSYEKGATAAAVAR